MLYLARTATLQAEAVADVQFGGGNEILGIYVVAGLFVCV